VLGSLERFIAIYVEHTGGDFPLWLAPVQVVVLPIAERHLEFARRVSTALLGAGIRAELDLRSEKLGFKIREAEVAKIPIMAVVGDQEQRDGTVTPRRRRGSKRSAEAVAVEAFVAGLVSEIAGRRS
jgi:threonyl-tRNA synthetase